LGGVDQKKHPHGSCSIHYQLSGKKCKGKKYYRIYTSCPMQNIKLLQTNIGDNLFFKRREFGLGGVNQRNASLWSYSKLAHQKIGLCKILAKINHSQMHSMWNTLCHIIPTHLRTSHPKRKRIVCNWKCVVGNIDFLVDFQQDLE